MFSTFEVKSLLKIDLDFDRFSRLIDSWSVMDYMQVHDRATSGKIKEIKPPASPITFPVIICRCAIPKIYLSRFILSVMFCNDFQIYITYKNFIIISMRVTLS